MKKIGLTGLIAGAFSVAVIGVAGPAQADDIEHQNVGPGNGAAVLYSYDDDNNYNPWIDKLYPTVKIPRVDTSVHN
jgi:hypothetical protein